MKNTIIFGLFLLLTGNTASDCFEFQTNYIDLNYGGSGRPGWVRAGDLDDDGDIDIIAGGGRALFVYENTGLSRKWKRYGNLDRTSKMGANGAVLIDVDEDGDLDVVSAKKNGDIGWWENPGGRLTDEQWRFHRILSADWFLHDLLLVDLDQDGRPQEFVANLNSGYWKSNLKIIWFRKVNDSKEKWERNYIESGRNEGGLHGHAGLAAGDVNQDGKIDIAYSNGWYEAPDSLWGRWIWHSVSEVYGISNTILRDLDKDGDPDLIVSAGHHGTGVFWYENKLNDSKNSWQEHTIDKSVVHPEGLAVEDMDGDGDFDIVASEMDFKQWNLKVHNVYLYENTAGASMWKKHNIAPDSYPSHQLQVIDINKDWKKDFISEGAGFKVVSFFENISN